jgi:hypothetical protein
MSLPLFHIPLKEKIYLSDPDPDTSLNFCRLYTVSILNAVPDFKASCYREFWLRMYEMSCGNYTELHEVS